MIRPAFSTLPLRAVRAAVLVAVALAPSLSRADEPAYQPKIAAASNEAQLAIPRIKVPAGMRVELVAAEPLLANPVAFTLDERGRIFVAETFRQNKGVEDNRGHGKWLHDDLALQTVEQRLEMFRKHLGDGLSAYAKEHDRVRLLEDLDGDGRIDKATVFADGFREPLDGTGAGLLARRGDVWFTCIPKLWRLRDGDGDGRAEIREGVHHGFGVRVAFRGHDLHGLCFGPDGRLYFSVGDRGFHVRTKEGTTLARPDTGAVFRCEPDGSQLEVFAYGLRNPQELAFDDAGNLFTGDNNSDSGDKARWVYVVEGGDTGWRMYYQYLKDRGPWNRERIWHPYRVDVETAKVQPAYVVPPVAHLADGPSGLCFDPGVGLPAKYRGHFFLCDFRGQASNSGIRSFAVEPLGATFKLVDSQQFAWSVLATDAEFGPDGALYLTDWVAGWDGPGKGRIYRLVDESSQDAVKQAGTAKLLAEGFDKRSVEELVGLLEHVDRRVRQEAQFALAERGAVEPLSAVARSRPDRQARRHATWGLGQILRRGPAPAVATVLQSLLEDESVEIRAQACRVLGDAVAARERTGQEDSTLGAALVAALTKRLADADLRVRSLAAIALGKTRADSAVPALLALLDENKEADPVVRHAGSFALAEIGRKHPQSLLAAAKHPARFGRSGVLLALRRLESPEIARYLDDPEPDLVLEAARAIHDVPIAAGTAALAALADRRSLSDPLVRRVIAANHRLGDASRMQAVARIAGDARLAEPLRLEALGTLENWADPSPLDRTTGAWRPIGARSANGLAEAIRPSLGGLFAGSDGIRQAAARLAAKYGVREVGPVLAELAEDAARPAQVRIEALRALDALKDERVPGAMKAALAATDPLVRSAGRRLLARLHPEKALISLEQAVETGETIERQQALDVLAALPGPAAESLLVRAFDAMTAGKLPAEVHLDVLTAAERRDAKALKARLEARAASLPPGDPLAPFRPALAGGDAERGREIFFTHGAVLCRRCHVVGESGSAVGPDLSGIGLLKPREYLLESLVFPGKEIAKGFETVVLALDDGKVVTGMVRQDDGTNLHLMAHDGQVVLVPKSRIEERSTGKSGMPEDVAKHLSKAELRDLVEFLAQQRRAVAMP